MQGQDHQPPPEVKALLEAQSEFLKAWAEHGQSFTNAQVCEPIEKVKQALHGQVSGELKQLLDILCDQWQVFHQSGEALIAALNQDSATSQCALDAFQDAMNQHIQGSVANQWQLSPAFAAYFNHLASELSALLADKDHKVTQHLGNLFNHLESLNPLAQSQGQSMTLEQLQEASDLYQDYQQTLSQYLEQFALINKKATEQLSQQMSQAKVNNLHSLRLIWVECYEASYADTVFTVEYQSTHAQLSNKLLRLQGFMQTQWHQQLSQLNIASLQTVDQLVKSQHQLRKEVKSLKQQLKAQQLMQQQQLDEALGPLRAALGLNSQETP